MNNCLLFVEIVNLSKIYIQLVTIVLLTKLFIISESTLVTSIAYASERDATCVGVINAVEKITVEQLIVCSAYLTLIHGSKTIDMSVIHFFNGQTSQVTCFGRSTHSGIRWTLDW